MKKTVLLIILILITLAAITYGDLILYGLRQGTGQVKVLWHAVPNNKLINDPEVPDSIKYKLRLISEIKQYAVNELGISDNDNYNSLYDQGGNPILWNVSASAKFKLEAYEWSFPLLGKFSYKGFFNYELALKEEKKLEALGLDTRVRTVGGWSTLGWFNDPILSNMLNRSEGQLAELIIHELIHGNIYIKDSVDFNENMATFFGQRGAIDFLQNKYGKDSPQLRDYINTENDFTRYVNHMLNGASLLDSLYNSMNEELHEPQKERKKLEMIQSIVNTLDTITFQQKGKYYNLFPELPNNAYFMALNRYRSKSEYFENELKYTYNNDLKSFLAFLISEYPSL